MFQQNDFQNREEFKKKRKYDNHTLYLRSCILSICVFYLFFCPCFVACLYPGRYLHSLCLAFCLFEFATFCLSLPHKDRRHSYIRTNRLFFVCDSGPFALCVFYLFDACVGGVDRGEKRKRNSTLIYAIALPYSFNLYSNARPRTQIYSAGG